MRVVIVGHGMVGRHFAAELIRLVRPTRVRLDVTVLAAESGPAYNSELLVDVLAGRTDPDLLETRTQLPAGWRVLSPVAAQSIDRRRRVVEDSDGKTHPYDLLVLATGASAIPGVLVDGRRPLTFRSRGDLFRLRSRLAPARRVAVQGGGVDAIEVACALRFRGHEVVLAEPGPQLLPGLLDPQSAEIAAAGLADLGIDVHTSADLARISADETIACLGVRPRSDLAAEAGLSGRGGIVTDEHSFTADPRIAAIGDCARRSSGPEPTLDQGLRSATRLAQRIAGVEREEYLPPLASRVVRSRAIGLDLLFLGATAETAAPAGEDGPRVITLLDPKARRAVRLAVRMGRLVAATLVGTPDVMGDLALTYTRATPVPADPTQLLVRGFVESPPSDDVSADTPFVRPVCRCNSVTEEALVDAFHAGATDIGAIATATRATTGCGSCTDKVCSIIQTLKQSEPDVLRL